MMVTSFGDVASKNRGSTTGFDYLRIGLATAVVVSHCVLLGADHVDLARTYYRVLIAFIMPAFFSLSGYLVVGSLQRNTIPQFIGLRALRIFPALAVEVTLSAFVLGSVFTSLPLSSYFVDPAFGRYLLNMLGFVHYQLPGVFNGESINLQLWTIPIELECYIALIALGMIGLIKRRHITLIAAVIGVVLLTALRIHLAGADDRFSGRVLVFSFLFGCLIYLYREKLPFNTALLIASVVLSATCLAFPMLSYLATAPVAYITIFVGLQRFRPVPFGDLSYGLYLFHYPVALTISHLTGSPPPPLLLFVETMIVTTVFAAASWTLIESPLQGQKQCLLAWIDGFTPRRLTRAQRQQKLQS